MKRALSAGVWCTLALALVATMLLGPAREPAAVQVQTVADLGQFNPGNIISDSIFFNGNAMGASDIQTFLDLKGVGCRAGSDGTPCLRNYVQDTTDRAADSFCSGYTGAAGERASTIVAKVAASCRINPQVLLVMLQKEQGLVLGSGAGLYASRYQKAMGFACPDTAACDAAYFGFQNQVYSAARQYQRYAASPNSFGYRAGRTSNVLYNPNSDCGSSPVYIQNQATAGLYIYTPYQPNAAALSAGYGSGDGCSAYGNRNFWLYFTDWFGSTQLPGQSVWQPVGSLDTPTVTGGVVTVSGWAVDPDDVAGARTVHVYVDGAGVAVLTADQYSSQTGSYQGYFAKLPVSPGSHRVCTYAINVGAGAQNTNLGCATVTASSSLGDAPTGAVGAVANGRAVSVGGWALDPNSPASPIDVHVYADGVGTAVLRAAGPGSPTAAMVAGAGTQHSYSVDLVLGPGRHQVCAYGMNVGAGSSNTHLGCVSVVVDAAAYNPVASWETMTTRGAAVVVTGWAQDLDDANGAIQVHAYVDGVGSVMVANGSSAANPGHGFSATIPVGLGAHQVCLYAINVGPGTTNPHLGCRSVTLDAASFNPVGSLDAPTTVGGAVTVSGWATDPDIPTQAVTVHVYVDGTPRAALAAAGPNGTADGHGYSTVLDLAQGPHSVCTYAINVGYGTTNTHLGCRSVTVSANPVGALESVTSLGAQVTVSGWATDPDVPSQPLLVHVYADGRPVTAVLAAGSNPAADGHGYSAVLNLAEGAHSVCTYAINVGAGDSNTHLGCRSVTVSSNPSGTLESVTAAGYQVTASGYVSDPDVPSQALLVHVYVDGRATTAVLADQANPASPGHGYAAVLTLAPGSHSVCTYGINVGAGTSNTHLGCRTVVVSANPYGALQSVSATGSQVALAGYAVDPDAPAQALQVHVYVDGAPLLALLADQPNPAADGHGYGTTLTLSPGQHTVCTWAINVGAGTSNTSLGCQAVAVG